MHEYIHIFTLHKTQTSLNQRTNRSIKKSITFVCDGLATGIVVNKVSQLTWYQSISLPRTEYQIWVMG